MRTVLDLFRALAPPARDHADRIPSIIKLAYTVFILVTVPYYGCVLGPVNFLYYCDFALLLALPAIWWESRLLISTVTVGILLPQMLWILDFFGVLTGRPVIGIASYMVRPDLPLFARALSTFHIWQPVLLLWLTARLGYDKRALPVWTVLAWALMSVCFLWVPEHFNINYVFGPGNDGSQTWMPAVAYFLLLLTALPVALIWPAHLVLQQIFADHSDGEPAATASGKVVKSPIACTARRANSTTPFFTPAERRLFK